MTTTGVQCLKGQSNTMSKKSHNCKGIERTFASSEARREFLKSLGGTEVVSDLGKHDVIQVRFQVLSIFTLI